MIELKTLAEFRLPTPEESRKYSEEWAAPLRPCLYTRWPNHYRTLSFPTCVEELTRAETNELVARFECKATPWSESLQAKIVRGVSQFPGGSFFKLESRSPKDNYWGEMTNFRACSVHDVRELLYSERILDDLARYVSLESEPLRLLFREWTPIPKESEFRCFIRGRKLAGISQYHYAGFDEACHENKPLAFSTVFARAEHWMSLIGGFIRDEIIPHLHVDDLVVDVWVNHLRSVRLIEINPYGLSDPWLFTYPELDVSDGELRVVMPD